MIDAMTVQRCVDPHHETVGAVDFRLFGAVGSELAMVSSPRWLYYDDRSCPAPLLAARAALQREDDLRAPFSDFSAKPSNCRGLVLDCIGTDLCNY